MSFASSGFLSHVEYSAYTFFSIKHRMCLPISWALRTSITEKHYAPWVRSRQEQLEAYLANAWSRDSLVLSQSGVHQRYTERSGPTTHSSSTRKSGARGGSRTHMRKNPRRILSPQRLPFRHPGKADKKSSMCGDSAQFKSQGRRWEQVGRGASSKWMIGNSKRVEQSARASRRFHFDVNSIRPSGTAEHLKSDQDLRAPSCPQQERM